MRKFINVIAMGALMVSGRLSTDQANAGVIAVGNAGGQTWAISDTSPYAQIATFTRANSPVSDMAFMGNGNLLVDKVPAGGYSSVVYEYGPITQDADLDNQLYYHASSGQSATRSFVAPLSDGHVFEANNAGFTYLLTGAMAQETESGPYIKTSGTGFNSVINVSALAGGQIAIASNGVSNNYLRIMNVTNADAPAAYMFLDVSNPLSAGAALSDGRYAYGDTLGNVTVTTVSGSGNITYSATQTTSGGFGNISAMVQLHDGNLAVANQGGTISIVAPGSLGTTIMSSTGLGAVTDLVVLANGNLAYGTSSGVLGILDPANNLASLGTVSGFGNITTLAATAPVPEPSALLLSALPLALLRRRRNG